MSFLQNTPRLRKDIPGYAQNMPDSGWYLEDISYIEDPDSFHCCDWCHYDRIKYVHRMRHTRWLDPLDVGCCCAVKIAEDPEESPNAERQFKNARKRKTEWKLFKSGNPTCKIDGVRVVCFPQNDMWVFACFQGPSKYYSLKKYPSKEQCKSDAQIEGVRLSRRTKESK